LVALSHIRRPYRPVPPPNPFQEIAMLPTPDADSTTSTATAEGRDPRGRFVAGNRGGPGNPFARQIAALRKAFLDSVTPEDLAAIAQALLAKAKAGDVAAAKLVLAYLLGKPAAAADPDQLDVEKWQNFKDCAGMMRELPKLVTTPVPQLPLEMVRACRVGFTKDVGRQLSESLPDPMPTRAKAAPAKNPSPSRFSSGAGTAPPMQQPAPSANGQNGPKPSPSRNGHDGPGPQSDAAATAPKPSRNGLNGPGAQPETVQ
jgi:hypothetical protein